ncbi:uncharacterized protein EV420DRAFT_1734326 [Desarmillaria tabescens]|uniref:Uncharacterized protein n=1 Tax=Armillaria tabescens TaxID=1929756 RepID=A0AA39NAW3_ARMTA|nr:uncharacterized protein EV420DRAFT_1734326 [Desarmillaria tabescens]KAK0462257.1 hypothetical protein EV420DRAFT_1734326 [Desarmillaria tabescens]
MYSQGKFNSRSTEDLRGPRVHAPRTRGTTQCPGAKYRVQVGDWHSIEAIHSNGSSIVGKRDRPVKWKCSEGKEGLVDCRTRNHESNTPDSGYAWDRYVFPWEFWEDLISHRVPVWKKGNARNCNQIIIVEYRVTEEALRKSRVVVLFIAFQSITEVEHTGKNLIGAEVGKCGRIIPSEERNDEPGPKNAADPPVRVQELNPPMRDVQNLSGPVSGNYAVPLTSQGHKSTKINAATSFQVQRAGTEPTALPPTEPALIKITPNIESFRISHNGNGLVSWSSQQCISSYPSMNWGLNETVGPRSSYEYMLAEKQTAANYARRAPFVKAKPPEIGHLNTRI